MIKINIGFIGAGKVGFSLGKYFTLKGKNVVGFYSANFLSAKEASEFIDCMAFHNLEDLIKSSDIIFITTNDHNILNIWHEIKQFNLEEKIICHCSGSLNSKIFSNINNSSVYTYSIHPMYAFSDKYESYKNLHEAYFSIEGNLEKLNIITDLITSLGNKVTHIDTNKKPLYHLANVTVSNLILSLIDIGVRELTSCGINYDDALEALFPLIVNNITNIKEKGITDSLTGPIERNDITTIVHHLEVVPDDFLCSYKELSKNLVNLSLKKNSSKNYSEIIKMLT